MNRSNWCRLLAYVQGQFYVGYRTIYGSILDIFQKYINRFSFIYLSHDTDSTAECTWHTTVFHYFLHVWHEIFFLRHNKFYLSIYAICIQLHQNFNCLNISCKKIKTFKFFNFIIFSLIFSPTCDMRIGGRTNGEILISCPRTHNQRHNNGYFFALTL